MFRINEGQIQVGVPVELNGIGDNFRIILQAKGDFQPGADGVNRFKASTLYLGSCRIPNFQHLSASVSGGLAKAMGVPEDVLTAWSSLSEVVVDGDTIKLARR